MFEFIGCCEQGNALLEIGPCSAAADSGMKLPDAEEGMAAPEAVRHSDEKNEALRYLAFSKFRARRSLV